MEFLEEHADLRYPSVADLNSQWCPSQSALPWYWMFLGGFTA